MPFPPEDVTKGSGTKMAQACLTFPKEYAMIVDVLKKYVEKKIGVNIHGTGHIYEVQLIVAANDHFTVVTEDGENTYHIPYSHIAYIVENPNGVREGTFLFRIKTELPVFIRLSPQLQYTAY